MKIHAVITLGTSCFASWLCKEAKLKRFSCPFDWIFTDTAMAIDCIQTDFTHFLDKSTYGQYLDDQKSASHTKYGNIFLHHDPRQFEDYHYFMRCVGRFRRTCQTDTLNVLFLQVFYNKTNDQLHECISEAEQLFNTLSTHVKSNFTLLVILHSLEEPSLDSFTFNRSTVQFICKIVHIKEVLRDYKFIEEDSNKQFTDILLNTFEYDLLPTI